MLFFCFSFPFCLSRCKRSAIAVSAFDFFERMWGDREARRSGRGAGSACGSVGEDFCASRGSQTPASRCCRSGGATIVGKLDQLQLLLPSTETRLDQRMEKTDIDLHLFLFSFFIHLLFPAPTLSLCSPSTSAAPPPSRSHRCLHGLPQLRHAAAVRGTAPLGAMCHFAVARRGSLLSVSCGQ